VVLTGYVFTRDVLTGYLFTRDVLTGYWAIGFPASYIIKCNNPSGRLHQQEAVSVLPPVLTSPTVACLNMEYTCSISSSAGLAFSCFTSAAASSNLACRGEDRTFRTILLWLWTGWWWFPWTTVGRRSGWPSQQALHFKNLNLKSSIKCREIVEGTHAATGGTWRDPTLPQGECGGNRRCHRENVEGTHAATGRTWREPMLTQYINLIHRLSCCPENLGARLSRFPERLCQIPSA